MEKYEYSAFNRKVTQLVTLIRDLCFHPIPINACLHYSFGRIVHRNWGDDINMFFLQKLWGKKLSPLFFSSVAMRKCAPNYMVIGSSITLQCMENTIIWGAGVIDSNAKLPAKPKKVLAVRGPLTRQYLLSNGVECPEIYGDPAMLIALYYKPKQIRRRYKLGIIPHYDDYNHFSLASLKENENVLFIRMEGYKKWTDVIDQICSCDYVASSSLHGLIMAEAYNIPNVWIEISGKLLGGYFKFHDFFLSMHADRRKPFNVTKYTTFEDILLTKGNYIKGYIDLTSLMSVAPFNLRLRF